MFVESSELYSCGNNNFFEYIKRINMVQLYVEPERDLSSPPCY
jgi:hypothetical protein